MKIFTVKEDSEVLVVIRANSKEEALELLRQAAKIQEIGGLFNKGLDDIKELSLEGDPCVAAYYFLR